MLVSAHHPLPLLLLLLFLLVSGKPSPNSNPDPTAWDWQMEDQVDYAKFNMYEEEMRKLVEKPYFAKVKNKMNVKRGEMAFLPCRVRNMREEYMATWMRLPDVTILSVGSLAFSSDKRFGVVHVHRPRIQADDWTLLINTTTTMDSGKYECSVNTLPKISHVVELEVEDPMDMIMQDSPYTKNTINPTPEGEEEENFPLAGPQAIISGPPTHYVSSGSTIGLECRISNLTTPPLSLYWNKEGKVFHARDRPGISLESEKVPGVSTTRLFISHVTTQDSGNYSCMSDIARPDTVRLVVTTAAPGSALVGHNSCKAVYSFHEFILVTIVVIYRQICPAEN